MAGGTWRIVERDAVDSTNDEARALAEAGEGRVAVRARIQTAGRGRQGRVWASMEGGLYLSAVVRPRLAGPQAGLLPLAAGLAFATLAEGWGLRPELRWPNDLLVSGRKAGGILCEARHSPGSEGLLWAVVGMGLNVAQPGDALETVGGTSLSQATGRALRPEDLVMPLLERLDEAMALTEQDPPRLVRAWSARAPMLGRTLEVATREGTLVGEAVRVEPTGALVVRTTDGEHRLTDAEALHVRL